MVLDQSCHLVGEPGWRTHSGQQGPGRTDARDIVPIRTNPSVNPLRGRRLAEVMTQRGQHQRQVVVAGRVPDPQGSRCVEDHQRVHPYVAFRMPLGVLLHAAQGVELGEESKLARRLQDPEPEGRAGSAQQQLPELLEHPLAGQLAQVERSAQRDQRLVGLHLEPGRELDDAQAAQRVFGKVLRIGRAQYAARQVFASAVRVQHLAGERVETDAVHGEVAAARGCGEIERRIGHDVEAAMPGTALAVASREREINVQAGDPKHAECAADCQHVAELREHGLETFDAQAEHLDVDILRGCPTEPVAHPAADHDGPAARVANGGRDVDDPGFDYPGVDLSGGELGAVELRSRLRHRVAAR